MKSGFLPSHLIVDDGLMPVDFSQRLDAFKEATGLSWDALAGCLGVDPPPASAVAQGYQAQWGWPVRPDTAGGPRTRWPPYAVGDTSGAST